jgi:hypothetical protein
LSGSHNSVFCYDSLVNDSKYTTSTGSSDWSFDADHSGRGAAFVVEGINNDQGYNVLFSSNTAKSQYLLYCDNCINCANCFGCAGLRDKKYCIFNTQYEKAEYEAIVANIIERMKET